MTDTLSQSMNATCCQGATADTCCEQAAPYTARFDIRETDNELVLYGDMPGVLPQDLDVRYENGELSIHGKVASRAGTGRAIRTEYGIGDFHRTFSVSESIDADGISATLKDGVLTIQLPKAEAAKPRRIKIQA